MLRCSASARSLRIFSSLVRRAERRLAVIGDTLPLHGTAAAPDLRSIALCVSVLRIETLARDALLLASSDCPQSGMDFGRHPDDELLSNLSIGQI
jgi:hypothetical protein